MECQKFRLPNKLRLLVVPMPAVASATATVWVRTGSRFEEKRTNGLSHFLEHMVFRGTRKYPNIKVLTETVDAIGGEFNAGTSKEWTNFYIKARAGKLETVFDVLSEMILAPLLKGEEIEKEKGVIIEEIRMYEDTPLMSAQDKFENVVYKGSKLEWDIIGKIENIKAIQKNDFLRYRKAYYYSENMLVTVAGGVNAEAVHKLAEKYFSGLPARGKEPQKPADRLIQKKPDLIVKNKKTDQAHLVIGFKGDPAGTERRFAEGVLATILGGGMSSRLLIEVREKRGLAYAVKTSSEHHLDNGYLATYAGVRIEKIEEAVTVILNQYYGISNFQFPISQKELLKAKEYLKGHIALALEDTKAVDEFFALEELLVGKTRTPEAVFRAIDKVTIEEVVAVAKDFFRPERLNLAVIGPFEDEKRFRKLLK